MKRINLHRLSESRDVTTGVLIDVSTGLPFLTTLEPPWRFNETFTSCIPSGVYVCDYALVKGKGLYRVLDVPGRTAVQIHVGNTVKDTSGCILIGMSYNELNGYPAVFESRPALCLLNQRFGDTFELSVS